MQIDRAHQYPTVHASDSNLFHLFSFHLSHLGAHAKLIKTPKKLVKLGSLSSMEYQQ